MTARRPTIAVCYDFDGTLIRGNLQENTFLPGDENRKKQFWREVKKYAKDNNMDEVLSYMELMLREAYAERQKFNKSAFKEHGKKLDNKFFPGVKEWFGEIDKYIKEKKLKVKVNHFVISSGIDEMIQACSIAKKFKYVYASGFVYDPNESPEHSARTINYTNKAQGILRINKVVHNHWDNRTINKFIPKDERPQPFSRMIYIGDGETDIPTLKIVKAHGGYSIVVYPPRQSGKRTQKEMTQKRKASQIVTDERAQYCREANYEKSGDLFRTVTKIIRRIADEVELQNMNPKERRKNV